MAWTAPMTFVANSPLTAAQLNTHLRDNLLETAPALATERGGYFVSTGVNAITERVGRRETIVLEEGTTTSDSYTDLDGASAGPSVTVQTGDMALVIWGAESRNSGGGTCRATVDVTGDTTVEGNDVRALTNMSGADNRMQASHSVWYDGLTPGENTFTIKYRVSSGTGSWQRRRLIVLPY